MSIRARGSGNKIVAGVFATVIISLILVTIYDIGRSKGIAEAEYQRSSDTYASHARKSIEEHCLLLQPVAQTNCIREVIEATREDQRAESGLTAQLDMAHWAFLMLIVAVITATITGVGVVFVRSTLVQAGETNEAAVRAAKAANEANRIMQSQARPWISIDQNVLCDFFYETGSDT